MQRALLMRQDRAMQGAGEWVTEGGVRLENRSLRSPFWPRAAPARALRNPTCLT